MFDDPTFFVANLMRTLMPVAPFSRIANALLSVFAKVPRLAQNNNNKETQPECAEQNGVTESESE